MKKFLFIMSVMVFMGLTGCAKKVEDKTSNYVLGEGLKDCIVSKLSSDSALDLYVVRCPNSSTSTNYTSGKAHFSNTVVDGESKTKTNDLIVVDGVTYQKEGSGKKITINGVVYQQVN